MTSAQQLELLYLRGIPGLLPCHRRRHVLIPPPQWGRAVWGRAVWGGQLGLIAPGSHSVIPATNIPALVQLFRAAKRWYQKRIVGKVKSLKPREQREAGVRCPLLLLLKLSRSRCRSVTDSLPWIAGWLLEHLEPWLPH